MTWKPPLLPDHYAAGESQKSMIYSYLLFLWYVRLDRTGVIISAQLILAGCKKKPPTEQQKRLFNGRHIEIMETLLGEESE